MTETEVTTATPLLAPAAGTPAVIESEESFSDRNVFPMGCVLEMKRIEI